MSAATLKLGILPLLVSVLLAGCNENDSPVSSKVPTPVFVCIANQYQGSQSNSCIAKTLKPLQTVYTLKVHFNR